MKQLFLSYIRRTNTSLNEFEMDFLAGVTVSFFVHFINSEMEEEELSTLMMDSWLDMTTYFFRVADVPDARNRILALIGQMHHGSENHG